MRGWRFIATKLDGKGGETLLDPDLPLETVTVTHVLSGPTVIEASIAPEIDRLAGPDGAPIFVPWQTAIYAEKDGVIRAGAILVDITSEGEKLELECTGFVGYLKDMPFTSVFRGYKLDPLNIARVIWSHVQGQTNGNLGLIVGQGTSPVRIGKRGQPALQARPVIRDPVTGQVAMAAQPETPAQKDEPYELAWYQTADLMKEFEQISEQTPFDYIERHWWIDRDSCDIQHVLDMGYPRISKKRDDLRFVVGENIYAAPTITEIGDHYASDVLVLGAGEGSAMAHGIATDYSQGRLRRVYIHTQKGIGKNGTAQNTARIEVAYRGGQVEFDEILVQDTDFARYGDINVGDMIYVQAGAGWYGQMNQWVRVIELSVSPDKDDQMRLLVMKGDTD